MSLMQLLAVGQSLRPIKDRPSRYRMRQQTLLPKFGPAPSASQPAAGAELGLGIPSAAPQRHGAEPMPPQQAASSVATVPCSKAGPSAPSVPAQPYPAGRWSLKSWPPFKRTAGAQPAKAPIQGELSLETVRPVRNDLTDSDLELVPAARPSGVGPRPKPPSSEPQPDPDRAASPLWSWLRRRLLKRVD